MSYDIQLFRIETKEKQQQSNDKDFFDNQNNFEPFTEEQIQNLTKRLLRYNYFLTAENQYGIHFQFEEEDNISVLLTDSALYFSATGEGIFEIGMTASEFTDTEEYAKYDSQNGGWEEL
ncbi:hypothetical protein [Flavobacterium sp. '19STA2R22 D10 B1']|uniref:hypothetical protein n=1 Tax=Flavobacterium aerium TaxID=3037261 RepID=UPI00278BE494|nr:hypothetical protein [Flavobacterium sp. '19STA2R22 D10 B1']